MQDLFCIEKAKKPKKVGGNCLKKNCVYVIMLYNVKLCVGEEVTNVKHDRVRKRGIR